MTEKINIQVFSDIHIESWNKLPIIPIKSKFLFLAGDICPITHPLFYPFFEYCSKNWKKVFYISGPEEFYIKKKNFNELSFEYKYKLNEKFKNVFYLNNECILLNDEIDVYGSTFWTVPNVISTYKAKSYIKDFNNITYFNQKVNKIVEWDINYVEQLAEDSFNLLKNHLEKTKKQTIIMTHFPPITTGVVDLNTKYNDITKSYLSWDDDTIDYLDLKNVPIWISGHTHWSYNIKKNNCKYISNQVGYKSEMCNTGINENGIFEIDIIS